MRFVIVRVGERRPGVGVRAASATAPAVKARRFGQSVAQWFTSSDGGRAVPIRSLVGSSPAIGVRMAVPTMRLAGAVPFGKSPFCGALVVAPAVVVAAGAPRFHDDDRIGEKERVDACYAAVWKEPHVFIVTFVAKPVAESPEVFGDLFAHEACDSSRFLDQLLTISEYCDRVRASFPSTGLGGVSAA